MITASLSTVAWRRPALERMLPTIVPQVDRLNVYLQGYDAVPDCLRGEKIHVIDGRDHPRWTELRSNAKLFWAAQGLVDPGVHLCVDDDIDYPPSYVARVTEGIDRYRRRAVVGFHGSRYTDRVESIRTDRTEWHYEKACDADTAVHVIGTGTIGWHTDTLRLTPDDAAGWDGIDLRVAIAAQRQQVPMVCLRREAGFLASLPLANDMDSCSGRADYFDRMLEFYRSWSPWTLHPVPRLHRDRPVMVVMPCYREDPARVSASIATALAMPIVDMVTVVDDASPVPLVLPPNERVTVIRRSVNGGPSAALNTGIRTFPDDSIVARLDVGDLYRAEAKTRQIEMVRTGGHRAVCSWHWDPVRHFVRTLAPNWRQAIYIDNQFASTAGVHERSVWEEVGGYDDSKRWTDDWRFAIAVQALVGWTELPEVTGDHGMFPGGHSDVSSDPIRRAARDRDMAHTVEYARAMGAPDKYAHLFNPKWCKKRGIEPLKRPGKR